MGSAPAASSAAVALVRRGFARFYGSAFALLILTMLMWAGNVVATRLAVGQISPMALTCLRWVLVCALLNAVRHRLVRSDWQAMRAHWRLALVMAVVGLTGFNALFYTAGHLTSGVNIAIVQGAIPIFVLSGNFFFFGSRTTLVQWVGLALTLLGIAVVATHGDLGGLRNLRLNLGDGLMLGAGLLYSAYTLLLRRRPAIPAFAFFTILAYGACLTSLPLLAYEVAIDRVLWPTPAGALVLLYVALFPSFLSQVFYLRAVQLIGPSRAGLFVNLLPVFGALLSVAIIGEPFGLYHAVALALVLGGIFVAESATRK